MKFAVFCVIVALAFAQATYGQSHNIEWGTKGPNDLMLYREIVLKEFSFLQIVTKDVKYTGQTRITYIKCTDQYINDNGGYATLLGGGVGYNDVSIHLKSQRSHGFNFIIEIYGNNTFK